ncbi:MAG: DDE-type integrase/transposase/recombinase, partial [Gammaproteobacteria bacterium]|nr:DDE-type integrase/transposase/recombinase [Gammaproteobacteria bacterium]
GRISTTPTECLGLKHALENWSWYLLGSKFNVVLYSDHQALQALAKSKINNTRISNWQLAISPYRFTVQYKPGRSAIMAGPDCLSRLLQESWKHYRNNDNEWTTVDFYDEVPAFKQLFEKLESDDRDFLTPKVDTETVSVYQKGGGKKVSSETSAIFEIQQDRSAKEQQSFLDEGHERPQLVESLWDPVRKEDSPPGTPYDHASQSLPIQQYDHAAQRQAAYKRAVDYEVHTVAHDPYGTLTHEVRYMASDLPLDFGDTTPEKDAIHGAQGRLKGDMYNASNNDMPVSIAKRFNINLKKLLHNNSMQHPGLKAKSKLKANTPIILQNRVIGERTMQGATMIELPRLNIADIKIKPTDYEGTCYESAYHDEKVAEQSNMLKVGKILYYHHAATGKWRIVLPTKEQQHAVVQEVHGYAEGHLKPWRMREIISPKYYWRGLKDTLKQYQQECEHCNRHDNRNQVPALGYYSVWETPLAPAMAYAMDLITDLPPAGPQFDCVLVITDRYSRYTIAIPTYKSLTGEEAARLFFEHVVLIHGRGLPISIFSDRDPRFISAFFTEFFVLCGVKLSTTSGYRSTSNGLVERRNQDLEGRLRGHAFEPQKWLDKLPLAVYHINSTTCRTLGVCPIEAERGYKPRNPLDLLPGILADLKVHPTLKERLDALQQLQQEVEENIDVGTNKSLQRVNSNKRDANKKTVHYKPIKAGDMVWLSSRDVTVPAKAILKSKKLTPRFFGPYQVERFDAPATVKLKWTNSKSKVWPFFHVSRIRPYQGKVPHQLQLDGVLPEKQNPPEPIEIEYEVQRILAHRNGTEQTPGEYLVQWKGFNFEDCTWEPRNKLASAPLRIKEYHERLQRLENHDPSVQQDYGHGVLMVHKTSKSNHSVTRTPLKAFLPIVVRNIWEQYELQLQQLINSGLRCKELE